MTKDWNICLTTNPIFIMISGERCNCSLVVVEISNFSSRNDWLAYLVVDIMIYDESIVIQSQSIHKRNWLQRLNVMLRHSICRFLSQTCWIFLNSRLAWYLFFSSFSDLIICKHRVFINYGEYRKINDSSITILLRDEIQLLVYTGEQGSIRLFLDMPKIWHNMFSL